MTDDVRDLDGVGNKTAKQLKEVGYDDITSLARTNAEKLARRSGLSEGKAESVIDAARKDIRGDSETASFKSGDEVKSDQSETRQITTGSEAIDGLLAGGMPTGYVTEAYGQYGSGKTQLGHQLSVNVQRPESEGGLGSQAVYIDTEETFQTDRIEQMARSHGMDADDVLENIHYAAPADSMDQIEVTPKAQKICANNDVGLVVVDSIIAHFRADYTGRGDLAERQQLLNEHLKDLRELASSHNLAVYITNQVNSNPDKMFGDPIEPVGGNVLGHNSSFRLYLKQRSKANQEWDAELVDSPHLPQDKVEYTITDEGVRDT